MDATGLTVEVSYQMGSKPARVAGVELRIRLPRELPDARRAGLLAVAGHCTVHNSLTRPPAVAITLTDTPNFPGHPE
ncbi:MAG TPA: hypothetical protein VK204_01350 [Nocardioidaceae bacterium]|jgi:uncharacterized OsmC-like protein|nr:hypothetical protein [Nocardioidaceae bacterium]